MRIVQYRDLRSSYGETASEVMVSELRLEVDPGWLRNPLNMNSSILGRESTGRAWQCTSGIHIPAGRDWVGPKQAGAPHSATTFSRRFSEDTPSLVV